MNNGPGYAGSGGRWITSDGVYYTLHAEEVVLWAVLDLRRDPEWIRQRRSEG